MPTIDPSAIGTYIGSVTATDEQIVQDAFARLTLALVAVGNLDTTDARKKAQLLDTLTGKVNHLAQIIPTEETEAALATVFGNNGSTPGVLGAPNADVVNDLIPFARQELGTVSPAVANARALVARQILGGSIALNGDVIAEIGDLNAAVNTANAEKAAAEAAKTTAETAKAAAEAAKTTAETTKTAAETERDEAKAIVDDVKSNLSGGGNRRILKFGNLTDPSKAALS